jgi:hypothetical protein
VPQGLQTFDASGNLIIDISTRMGRVLGIAAVTGGTDGSVTNSEFSAGTGFWQVVAIASGTQPYPDVSLSGTTLSWIFQSGISYPVNYKIIYGVY